MRTTTLLASALALASTAFALPQGPPQSHKGGNSGGDTEESPVNQGNGPPPSYGGHSGSLSGSPQGVQPNQAGSGGQPGNGIASPVGQNGIQPQGNNQPQGNLPGAFQNGNTNQQPGNAIGSPVGGTNGLPQNTNNQPQIGGGGQLPQGVSPNSLGGQPGGIGGTPRPQQFGQYHPNGQNSGQPGNFGNQPSGQGIGTPTNLSPQGSQPGQQGGIGSPTGLGPQNGQPGSGIGSPVGTGQLGRPPLGAPSGDNICGPSAGGNCVSQQEAEQFVQRFIAIITHQSSDLGDAQTTADQIIGDDWVEYSNSILSLQGLPLTSDGIAAHSKQEWTQGVLNAPPFGGVQTLKVLVACDQVLWYWNFEAIGSGKYPVKGFNLFTLTREGNEVVGSKLEIEFDSIAWGLDTGLSVTLRDGRTLPEGGPAQQPSGGEGGQQSGAEGQAGAGASGGAGGAGGVQLGVGGQHGINANMGVGGTRMGVGQNGINTDFAGGEQGGEGDE